jgi:guanine nucleotide-binding protein subunit beta
MKGSQEKVSIPTLVTLIKVSQFISTKGSGDMKVLQWDIATNKKIKSFDGHNGDIAALNLKPQDNQVFLTGSVDRTIRLWDLRTDSCQQTFW